MKKIILAGINARYTHSCLALYCLKSALRGLDVETVVRDFSINRNAGEIMKEIASEKADVIALSVYIWNSGLVRELIPALHEKCGGVLLVLGGPEVSYNPASWLEAFPFIDFIVTGHGEEGFRTLAEKGFRNEEKIIAVPNPPFGDMPIPYTEEDLEGLRTRYVYYESSRGCPYRCTYCLSSRSDHKLEMKDIETVKKELDFILRDGLRLVKFVDRTFNAAKNHSRALWRYLKDKYGDGPTTFHFEVHPHLLEEEDFEILSQCPEGLFQNEVGVQSTNPETVAAVKRAGQWPGERAALERLLALGTIRVHCDLIAGLPFDDMASIEGSFNDCYHLRPDHLQLGFLKVLPGTEMMYDAGRYSIVYSEKAPYRVLENRWVSGEDLAHLDRMAFLVDRLYNTGRFETFLSVLLGRFASPFAMFRELTLFRDGSEASMDRGWESGARFLMAFIDSRFPGDKQFFLDAMEWDWCARSRSLYFPNLIKPEGLSELKKKIFSHYKGLAGKGPAMDGGIRFDLSDLKRSLFFEPRSDEFRLRHMGGAAVAIFLPDKRVIMLKL